MTFSNLLLGITLALQTSQTEIPHKETILRNHQSLLTVYQQKQAKKKPKKKTKETVVVNERELKCLAEAIYHESRSKHMKRRYAVAHVVLNRVEDKRWAESVCAVVYQKYQFSWTKDKPKVKDKQAWQKAKEIAYDLLVEHHLGIRDDSSITNGSLFFKTNSYHKGTIKVAKIGNHYFSK